MFLIRIAFWLSLVILFLPAGDGGSDSTVATDTGVGLLATEAIGAARETVVDISTFCERNPATCETGSAALKVFGEKAEYGARLVYEYLSESDGQSAIAGDGATRPRHATSGTLTPEDLEMPWQGPDLRS